MSEIRTLEDLDRAVRAIARHFKTDEVIIVGSQSVLLDWPDAPVLLRTSGEIDAYPGNIRDWEASHVGELASEEINALFGWGSQFHDAFGFYIDGVDETTARLPPDWQTRALIREIVADGITLRAVAPSPEDIIAAKLHRLAEKDRRYIAAWHAERTLDPGVVLARLAASKPASGVLLRARAFLASLV